VSRRGESFENPVTGERAVVLTDPYEHPERVLVAHLFVAPGGRVALAHRHPNSRERFHVLAGQVGFKIAGEEEASVVVEVAPGDRFVEMIGTFFGLARDGKVDGKGIPHPLQLAVTASAYRDTMVPASPPEAVQRLAFGILAPLGRALGRKPIYDRYLASDMVIEPDPAALVLVGDDGRLIFGAAEPAAG
jgi:mannose-6-phosphate isomerase-like protein (cupin superfamily)